MLGLLHRSFSKHQTVTAKRTLYISLVRSQVIYGSVIWKPNHIKQGRIQGGGGLWGLKPPFILRLYLINMLRIIMKFIYLFFIYLLMLYTAQVLKVCRTPGPTACSKTLAT